MSARLDPAFLRPDPSTGRPGRALWRSLPATPVYRLAGTLATAFALAALFLASATVAVAVSVEPEHGVSWSTDLAHVAAAWGSLGVYLMMAACATLTLTWKGWLAPMAMRGLAPAGGVLTLLGLWTASLIEIPRGSGSGAQLTSELVLLVMYASFMFLRSAINDPRRADRACAALVLVGAVNLPMIYFSVQWWDMLHRAAELGASGSAAAQQNMMVGVLLMTLAFCACAVAVALGGVRRLMLLEGLVYPGLSSQEIS